MLTPQNSAVLLIDHQPFQFANLRNQDPTMVMNNVVALAKSAKVFNVPTVLTTVLGERGGHLAQQIQDVFPEQKPIDRTWINAWQDERIPAAVKATGRKKIVMAALWTEICLVFPVIHALSEGYDVFIVTDASGASAPRLTSAELSGASKRERFRSRGWPFVASGSATGPGMTVWVESPPFSLRMAARAAPVLPGRCNS